MQGRGHDWEIPDPELAVPNLSLPPMTRLAQGNSALCPFRNEKKKETHYIVKGRVDVPLNSGDNGRGR